MCDMVYGRSTGCHQLSDVVSGVVDSMVAMGTMRTASHEWVRFRDESWLIDEPSQAVWMGKIGSCEGRRRLEEIGAY